MEIEHDEANPESSLSSRWNDSRKVCAVGLISPPLLSATEKQIEMIHSRMVQRILYCLDYIHMSTKDEVRTRSA